MKRSLMKVCIMLLVSVVFLSSVSSGQDREKTKAALARNSMMRFSRLDTAYLRTAYMLLRGDKRLDLNAEQSTKIRALVDKSREKLAEYNSDLRGVAVELNTMLWEAPGDTQTINSLMAQRLEVMKQMDSYVVNSYKDLMGILTPEQKKIAKEMVSSPGRNPRKPPVKTE